MEDSYYLIYKEGRKGGEVLFNVGTKETSSTLIRLSGQGIRGSFNNILQILSKAGCLIPVQTGNPRIYSLRGDVGPVIGTYLILIKRAKKMDYWVNFLDELLTGKYSKLGETFAIFLETMVRLSKRAPSGKGYALSPSIVSSFSSALKVLIKSLTREKK
ncbi:MAG: hypothetical protein NDP24_06335 [Crenarchaeota archaeon]|nr:hypothetical protein [Thermoproteota archaeon]